MHVISFLIKNCQFILVMINLNAFFSVEKILHEINMTYIIRIKNII